MKYRSGGAQFVAERLTVMAQPLLANGFLSIIPPEKRAIMAERYFYKMILMVQTYFGGFVLPPTVGISGKIMAEPLTRPPALHHCLGIQISFS